MEAQQDQTKSPEQETKAISATGSHLLPTIGANKPVMRNGQNKRMRGRNRSNNNGGNNNNRSHNPLTKVFESNGPDVKIRGTASHVAEKYIQLARDAQSSGDPVAAENYYQHAEHYFRLIAAAQEQFRQSPQYNQGQNNGSEVVTGNDSRDGSGNDSRDGSYDDEEGDDQGQNEQPQFGTRDPQPFIPRDAQFAGQNNDRQNNERQNNERYQNQQPRQNNNNGNNNGQNGNHTEEVSVDRLPSFITGGGGQPQPQPNDQPQGNNGEGGDRNGGERYGFRRRRHRRPGAPRSDAPQDGGGEDAPQG
jgi:hypothetical protein